MDELLRKGITSLASASFPNAMKCWKRLGQKKLDRGGFFLQALIHLNEFPGWIRFSMDSRYAYSSTGEIIDVTTKKIVATLREESGHLVQSEKLLDLEIANGKVVRSSSQFGVGQKLK